MSNTTWRKRISVLMNRLYLYPSPDPMPHTRLFWLATGVVTVLVLLFCGFFVVYLTGLQDAYLTHAEDMGIMDQAIWNTLHGQVMHQTICNILNDTNCFNTDGISRFAIHFEPILFLVSLFYLVAPDPKTLIVLQTIIVGLGAFPAFWLARLRLRNEWAAMAIAALYLLFPAVHEAVIFDFHAVTLTAALLLFTLYFMYTRRTVWLLVFALLSMACKEEIPLVIAVFGLWSLVFQRRWRSGLTLVGMALVWIVIWQVTVHFSSPGGRLLLAPRYANLGHGPVEIARNVLLHPIGFLKTYVFDHGRMDYLHILFAPSGFLAVLAPWVILLALPSLAINMLSSDTGMYSGYFHYSAEIVPVLIFATIEALVLILWLVQVIVDRVQGRRANLQQENGATSSVNNESPRQRKVLRLAHAGLLTLLSVYILFSVVRIDYLRGHMPFSLGFQFAQTTPHALLAQRFVDMIPPDASVSAQSSLVPHVSHRANIYLFPYAAREGDTDEQAQYIFLDVTSDIYPYFSSYYYIADIKKLLLHGKYGIVAAQDGYLLLKQGLPPPGVSPYSLSRPGGMDPAFVLPNFPPNFCSYLNTPSSQVLHPVQVTFTSPDNTGNMDLVGYNVAAPSTFSISGGYMTVSTYWRVNAPTTIPVQPIVVVDDAQGREHLASFDFPAAVWCQTNTWQSGGILRLDSRIFGLQDSNTPTGLAHISIALVPLVQSSSTILDGRYRFPLHIVNAGGRVAATNGTNALQLVPLTLIP